jgi:MMPL family
MFVLLFGLSMDYHVFILSRIREPRSRGATTQDAVIGGISNSAGVVTSAAVIMVAVFSILATLPIVDTKTLGIGLAAAVLIDATVVRGILRPAIMSLLGERSWYMPRWLSWLPGRRAGSTIEQARRQETSHHRRRRPPPLQWPASCLPQAKLLRPETAGHLLHLAAGSQQRAERPSGHHPAELSIPDYRA